MDGLTSNQFQGVAMNYIAISKDWLKLIFFILVFFIGLDSENFFDEVGSKTRILRN